MFFDYNLVILVYLLVDSITIKSMIKCRQGVDHEGGRLRHIFIVLCIMLKVIQYHNMERDRNIMKIEDSDQYSVVGIEYIKYIKYCMCQIC